MSGKTTNVFICGVGGQGILLASEILSEVALARGLDIKKSEVHGMAQRGGAVVSHVRFGERVHSPVIANGEADILVSFEKLEALRWLHSLSPSGVLVVNDQEITPSGMETYPDNVDSELEKRAPGRHVVNALSLAMQAGHPRAVNTVMLGAFSNFLPFTHEEWQAAIEKRVPPKTTEINVKAFDLGRASIQA